MLQRQLYDLQAQRDSQAGCEQSTSVGERDRQLISWLQEHLPTGTLRVVELGCGDGTLWDWDGGHFDDFTLRDLLLGAGLSPLGFRDPGARPEQLRRFAPALLAGNLAVVARK